MKNFWVTYLDPIASWLMDLSRVRDNPDNLLLWLEQSVQAGEETDAFAVHRAPWLGYNRERDGALAPFLRSQYEASGVLRLWDFIAYRPGVPEDEQYQATTRLAYADAEGRTVEDDVDSLPALLARLRPRDVESAPGAFRGHLAISFAGCRIDLREPGRSRWRHREGELRIHVGLHSDIWLPFVTGDLEERYQTGRLWDNRALARVHTPRLNLFLSQLRRATEEASGIWKLEEGVRADRASMIGREGIRLEAEAPGEVWAE